MKSVDMRQPRGKPEEIILPDYLAPVKPDKTKEKEVLSWGVLDASKLEVGDILTGNSIDVSTSIEGINPQDETVTIKGYRGGAETITFDRFNEIAGIFTTISRGKITGRLERPNKNSDTKNKEEDKEKLAKVRRRLGLEKK